MKEASIGRQIALITLAAVAIGAALCCLPSGPRLTAMDFLVIGPGELQFCDPLSPKLVAAASAAPAPATLTLQPAEGGGIAALRTVTGKAIEAQDIDPAAPLRLIAVDPSFSDPQILRAEPRAAGGWTFAFAPRAAGPYRIFADFTPQATRQRVHTAADFAGAAPAAPAPAAPGCRLALAASAAPIVARQPARLTLTARRSDGGTARLAEASAELLVFDSARAGFSDLRPKGPGGAEVSFFWLSSDPGAYVAWARATADGRETEAVFPLSVQP